MNMFKYMLGNSQAAENFIIRVFAIVGIVISLVVVAIAFVWAVCFIVKLLVKTFGVRVNKSYEIMVEDINKKAEAKKERNEIKRNAKREQKLEILNQKLESRARIHETRKQKLADKLKVKEDKEIRKMFKSEPKVEDIDDIEKKEEKLEKKPITKRNKK